MQGLVVERIAIRLAFAAMLLLGSCAFVSGGIREAARRLETGSQSIIVPAAGAVFAAPFLLFGLALLWRAVAEIRIARGGFTAPAAITRSVHQPNGTWVNHYKFQDRQGLPREASFRSDLSTWQAGDRGEVKWLEGTKYSVWLTEDGPRGPGVYVPPPPGSVKSPRYRSIFLGMWAALTLAGIAAAAYFGWRNFELHPESASQFAGSGAAIIAMTIGAIVFISGFIAALVAAIVTACVAVFQLVAMYVRPS
jgi:hypothetical protein